MSQIVNYSLTSSNFDHVLDRIVQEPQEPQNIQNKRDEENIQVETKNEQPSDINLKIDILSLTNGWNDKNETIVISIGENAASYKWMHEKSAAFYSMMNRIVSVIMIMFSTGLSAETILPTDNSNVALNVIRRILTYIVTFFTVLQNFMKYEQLSEQHISAAMAFSQLYHDIQQQMCMYRKDRINATIYVSTVLKQYDSLVVKGPTIDENIIKQFKNTFRNADIALPDIADKIQKIEIISEPIPPQPTNTHVNVSDGGNPEVSSTVPGRAVVFNDTVPSGSSSRRYGRYGFCNLDQIHNAFQIQGDITDKDVQNANTIELRELRNKYLREASNFEFQRALQNTRETD